jgi:hypothetical protein
MAIRSKLMRAAPRLSMILGAAVCPLIAACNALFSVNGYAGSGEPAGSDGSTVQDGRVGVDGSATDGAPVDVGTTDAGAASCKSGAIFCDDFDRTDGNVQGPWSSIVGADGGAITIVDDDASPSGHALDCTIDVGSSGTAIYLDKDTDSGVTKSATIQFGARVASPPESGGVHVSTIDFVTPTGRTSYVFPYVQQASVCIGELVCTEDAGCTYDQSPTTGFQFGEWHQIVLRVDFTVSPASYTLEIDGTESLTWASGANAMPGVVQIQGGPTIDPNAGTIDVRIDALLVTGQ